MCMVKALNAWYERISRAGSLGTVKTPTDENVVICLLVHQSGNDVQHKRGGINMEQALLLSILMLLSFFLPPWKFETVPINSIHF